MSGQRIGSVIAAVFGLVYVFVNTVALPVEWAWPLRGLAVAVFAAVLIAVVGTALLPAFGWWGALRPPRAEQSEPTYAEARES